MRSNIIIDRDLGRIEIRNTLILNKKGLIKISPKKIVVRYVHCL